LSNIINALKADETVKKYIELRTKIMENDEYMAILKSDLSLNKAKIDNSPMEMVINEYIELEKMVRSDLEMISIIINNEININFLD